MVICMHVIVAMYAIHVVNKLRVVQPLYNLEFPGFQRKKMPFESPYDSWKVTAFLRFLENRASFSKSS